MDSLPGVSKPSVTVGAKGTSVVLGVREDRVQTIEAIIEPSLPANLEKGNFDSKGMVLFGTLLPEPSKV